MKKTPTSKVEELREALKAKKDTASKEKALEKKARPEREENEILSDLHAAEKEAKEHYDKLLRIMAEFENFKKRASREQEERVKYANEKLMLELLPVLDDFDRVLDHVSEEKKADAQAITDGVGLVRKSLLNTLNKFGLSEIKTSGEKFNPQHHEAVQCIKDPDKEDDDIVSVHRKGYKLGDRVIRAAQVVVSKK